MRAEYPNQLDYRGGGYLQASSIRIHTHVSDTNVSDTNVSDANCVFASLHAGDGVFSCTKRIHRAPPPPPAGSPRCTLFGAFYGQGKTEGAPLLAGGRYFIPGFAWDSRPI